MSDTSTTSTSTSSTTSGGHKHWQGDEETLSSSNPNLTVNWDNSNGDSSLRPRSTTPKRTTVYTQKEGQPISLSSSNDPAVGRNRTLSLPKLYIRTPVQRSTTAPSTPEDPPSEALPAKVEKKETSTASRSRHIGSADTSLQKMDYSTYQFMLTQFTSLAKNLQVFSEQLDELAKRQDKLTTMLETLIIQQKNSGSRTGRSSSFGRRNDKPNLTVMIVPQSTIETYMNQEAESQDE